MSASPEKSSISPEKSSISPAAAVGLGVACVAATTYAYGLLQVHKVKNARKQPHSVPTDDEKPFIVQGYSAEPIDLPIAVSKKGRAAATPMTVFEVFDQAVAKHADAEAMKFEDLAPNLWKSITFKEYQKLSKQAAEAFIHLGVERQSAVAIIGFNSPQWLIANMGAIYAGAFSAGIYTTNKPPAAQYIVNHSKAAVVVVENGIQLEKFLVSGNDLPFVKAFVVYKNDEKFKEEVIERIQNYKGTAKILFWSEFLALGETSSGELQQRIAAQTPSSVCTLIYTSGTTGNPKAVMLTHDNVTWTSAMIEEALPDWGMQGPEHVISYLPLSHIAAQYEDIFMPLNTCAFKKFPVTVWFARPDALKGSLAVTLKAARPTMFFGVPRVWEKFMEKMQSEGKKASGMRKWVASTAKSYGLQNYHALQASGSGDFSPFYFVFQKFIYSAVRKALGLDRCKIFITGAAPIARETLDYFGSLGIVVHNLFGMSETTGPMSFTRPYWYAVGSVGTPVKGVEVRIDHVPGRDKEGEGEITVRGRNVMLGYLREPEKTKEMFDSQGFLKTGDVGSIDKDGVLWVTGRIKELLITAGGENIAPVPIEEALLKELPAISNAMLIGDKKKYNSVLLTLKVVVDEKTGLPTNELAGEAKLVSNSSKTVEQAKSDEKWKSYIEKGIKKYNAAAVSQAQQIQKYRILDKDFSLAGGELTDTLKLKRNVVNKLYEELIESIYSDDGDKE